MADVIALALQPGADLPALRTRVQALAQALPLYPGVGPSGQPEVVHELGSSVER